ncbi:MAG: phage holin family protein [Mangrovibacterium sp.]
MENPDEFFDELIDKGKDYGKTTAEIIKLKTLDKTSEVLSNVASWLPIIIVALLCFFTLNMGIAYLIGELTELGNATGFLIVTGFYLVLGVILVLTRERFIKSPIMDAIIMAVMNEKEEDKP